MSKSVIITWLSRLMYLGVVLLLVSNSEVLALSAAQKQLYQSGVYQFDIETGGECSETESVGNGSVGDFQNPIYPGVGQGPGVVRGEDGKYHVYLTSDDKNPFKQLESTDLTHWKEISRQTISNLKDIPKEQRNVMWAPDVAKTGDHYTMLFTGGSGHGSTGYRYIGYATSDKAGGPFTYRGKLKERAADHGPDEPSIIDPHIYQENDKMYVTFGSSPLQISELEMESNGSMRMVGGQKVLVERGSWASAPSTIEQSWLEKIGEWYYMFYSAGHFEDRSGDQEYSVRVARSKSLMGPYSPKDHSHVVIQGKDPFRAPGSSAIIQDNAGTYWMLYNAFKGDDRRLMLDKLNFDSGWPVANNGFPSTTKQSGSGEASSSDTTSDSICCPTGDGGTESVTLPDNAKGSNGEKLFAYLVAKGLTAKQAAGILGNVMQESGGGTFNINPKALNPSSGAYGIIQWTGGRKDNLMKKANYDTLDVQMDFMWQELNSESYKGSVLDPIKASTDYKGDNGSLRIWLENYEIPCPNDADPHCDVEYGNRLPFADQAYKAFKDLAPADLASDSGTSCGGDAFVDASGYAFPIVLPKNDVSNGYGWPCNTKTYCHHDGSPALDLAKKALDDSTAGTEVVAIYDGEIAKITENYVSPVTGKPTGCQALQFKDKNGWFYWYGHIRTDSRTPGIGKPIKAGDHIGKVGERVCTGNGSYPHLHIDRGFPKGHGGGEDAHRDPDFIKLINQLYENLP